MQIIDELEPVKRGGYGGAIGYLSYAGDLDTAIHIRTVVVKDGVAHIQAGGGTVADAKPDYEYEESVAKIERRDARDRARLRAARLAVSRRVTIPFLSPTFIGARRSNSRASNGAAVRAAGGASEGGSVMRGEREGLEQARRGRRSQAAAVAALIAVFALSGGGTAAGGATPVPIHHVVVILQENHTFDNVLGQLCAKEKPTTCKFATSGQNRERRNDPAERRR